MSGIYFREGIYFVVDNDERLEDCVFHPAYDFSCDLFGGRVNVSSSFDKSRPRLTVDGVSVVEVEYYNIKYNLAIALVASHLNAIEVNGVDAFIENYKKSIEFIYNELKDVHLKTEIALSSTQDDLIIKNLINELNKLRILLIFIIALLFNLYSHMSAGLENEKVISVYHSIIDTIA